jgi:hypothetical protein
LKTGLEQSSHFEKICRPLLNNALVLSLFYKALKNVASNDKIGGCAFRRQNNILKFDLKIIASNYKKVRWLHYSIKS